MRTFTETFKMGFKILWRSPSSVVMLTLFPIVLILILGTALSSYIVVDTALEKAPAAVFADENGALAAFLRSEEISRFLDVSFTAEDEAVRMVENDEALVAVIEKNGDIAVLRQPSAGIMTGLALSLIDSYKQIGAASTISAISGKNIYELLETDITIREIPLGKRVPGSIDYYAVTMIVMILMYSGINGAELFGKFALGETGERLLLSPASRSAVTGGALAASTLTSFLQGLISFAFTGLVYNVYWGERIVLVLVTLFAAVLFSQSFCVFCVMALRNAGAAAGIAQVVFWVTTFVSKGYAKVNFGTADEIFQYAPNAMAHTVIFGAIYGGNESNMAMCLFLLFALGAVFFLLAYLAGRNTNRKPLKREKSLRGGRTA